MVRSRTISFETGLPAGRSVIKQLKVTKTWLRGLGQDWAGRPAATPTIHTLPAPLERLQPFLFQDPISHTGKPDQLFSSTCYSSSKL